MREAQVLAEQCMEPLTCWRR